MCIRDRGQRARLRPRALAGPSLAARRRLPHSPPDDLKGPPGGASPTRGSAGAPPSAPPAVAVSEYFAQSVSGRQ
eukprot:7563929-Pyramimonas_sp.AAC.1